MEIDRERPSGRIDAAEGSARGRVGEQSEVTAAADRNVAAQPARRWHWVLLEYAGRRPHDEGHLRPRPVAARVASAGGDARIERVTFFHQHLERPRTVGRD